jgi:dephospho-CoA kinase
MPAPDPALAPARATPPRRIGLTGGIGSGKSTAARALAALGAHVVDTDAIAHRLCAPGGEAIAPLREAFGDAAIGPDGAMDRAAMRERVFADPDARRRLEAVLHPLIRQVTEREAAAAPPGAVVVFDVPLLAESPGWRDRVDRVLVIDCEAATQVRRVMARSGWTEAAVRRVIEQQATRERRRAIADAVILNEGDDPARLHDAVRSVWQDWGLPLPGSTPA